MKSLYLTISQVSEQTGFSRSFVEDHLKDFGFRKVLGIWKAHQMNVTAIMSGRKLRAGDTRLKKTMAGIGKQKDIAVGPISAT